MWSGKCANIILNLTRPSPFKRMTWDCFDLRSSINAITLPLPSSTTSRRFPLVTQVATWVKRNFTQEGSSFWEIPAQSAEKRLIEPTWNHELNLAPVPTNTKKKFLDLKCSGSQNKGFCVEMWLHALGHQWRMKGFPKMFLGCRKLPVVDAGLNVWSSWKGSCIPKSLSSGSCVTESSLERSCCLLLEFL